MSKAECILSFHDPNAAGSGTAARAGTDQEGTEPPVTDLQDNRVGHWGLNWVVKGD